MVKLYKLALLAVLLLTACAPQPTAVPENPMPAPVASPTELPSPAPDPGPWYGIPIDPARADQVRQLATWGKGLPWVPRDSTWYAPGKDNLISSGDRVLSGRDLGEIWMPRAARTAAGGQVLVVQAPTGIFLYSTADAALIARLADATVYKLSQDESLIVTGHRDGSVKVWNALDGSPVQEFHYELRTAREPFTVGPAVVPAVGDVALSYDGTRVAAGFADGRILIWTLENPDRAATLDDDSFARWRIGVAAIEFSPDAKALLSLNQRGIELWRLPDGRRLWGTEESYLALQTDRLQAGFSPDGSLMALLFAHGFRLMDLEGRVIYEYANGSEQTEWYRIADDWTQIFVDHPESGQRQVRSLPDGKLLETVPLPPDEPPFSLFEQGHVWGLRGAAVQPDRSILAWGFTNERLFWWRPDTNEFTIIPKDQPDAYFSEDGSLAALCEGGPVRVLTMDGAEREYALDGHQTCDGLVFSPAGDSFAVWTRERLDLVSLSTGEMHTLRDNTAPVIAAVFSDDGALLASAEGSNPVHIAVWDIATRERLAKFTAEGDWYDRGRVPPYYVLAFSPDNRTLLTRGHANELRLWDIAAGAETRRIDITADLADFSPDGNLLVTANRVGVLSLWSLPMADKIAELRGHAHLFERSTGINDSVPVLALPPDGIGVLSRQHEQLVDANVHSLRGLAFLPDGSGILSTGIDGTVRLWGLDPAQTDPLPPPPITDLIFERPATWDTLDLSGPLTFKLYPVANAEKYSWTLYQDDERVVWQEETSIPTLSLPKTAERDRKIGFVDLHIWVSAWVDGEWLQSASTAVHVK